MNVVEEMGKDARKNYDRLQEISRESAEDAAKVLSEVLKDIEKRDGQKRN
ncbi:MAG: hypothetical protein ACYDHX_03980 [Methanothrix sp.]